MKEQLILSVPISYIFSLEIIGVLARIGYQKTYNKFWISFHGSKGYLSFLAVECEGYQKANNRVFMRDILTKRGKVRKKNLNIFHSEENGVRLSIGKDKPQEIIIKDKKGVSDKFLEASEKVDDLPF